MDFSPAPISGIDAVTSQMTGRSETSAVGRRMFENIPECVAACPDDSPSGSSHQKEEDPLALIHFLYANIVGSSTRYTSPFGRRKVVYCDWTASGRALRCVEDFVRDEVLPLYGNTHSSVTVTAEQSTLFFHEAKENIRNAFRTSENDVVVLAGGGCTAAISVLVHALCLPKSPIVVAGPFEHHSNLLPWRELASQIFMVKEGEDGSLDLVHLEEILIIASEKARTEERRLIGVFSAASNITGQRTDADVVTELLHSHGAWAFWDYAAAAPYTSVEMNPVSSVGAGSRRKDAIYFSGHKFLGGLQTPGVLIAKKFLFANSAPNKPGGGTVFFVRRESHRYLKELESREEGGTPDIVGAIRLGLVLQLKKSIPDTFILTRHRKIQQMVRERWLCEQNLVVLGPGPSLDPNQLPIYSFLIRHPMSGLYLHHNFVCALLDNLFGIQGRAGCACAGPYALELVGIWEQLATRFQDALSEQLGLDRHHLRRKREYSDLEMLRPGFLRLSFPYFMADDDILLALNAVIFVARHGWKFLPLYRLNPESGEWHHRQRLVFKDRKWLGRVKLTAQGLRYSLPAVPRAEDSLELFEEAEKILLSLTETVSRLNMADEAALFSAESASLRWFLLSTEAQQLLLRPEKELRFPVCPFHPKSYVPRKKDSLEEHLRRESVSTAVEFCGEIPMEEEEPAEKTVESGIVCEKRRQDWGRRRVLVSREGADAKLRHRWSPPSNEIFKPFLAAAEEFQMIRDGDRVLVCLSGGKDSLSLLHILRHYSFYCGAKGVHFQLGAVTVDPGSDSYDPSPLVEYLEGLNVTYLYEEQRILEQAQSLENCESICSFCSRMKRGRIYAAARAHGFNVLAFGQHLDDLAESFLMSAFFNGSLRTMKANYTVREGDLRVIRPLAFVREKRLRWFAESRGLPVIPDNCPACFQAPQERHRMKQLLAAQELLSPRLFSHLLSALRPLMAVSSVKKDSALSQVMKNLLRPSECDPDD